MSATCPYDGNDVTADFNEVFWKYWHCDGCGNRWTLGGMPVGGVGDRLITE